MPLTLLSHEEHCIHSTKSVLVLSFSLKHIPQHVVSWVRRKPLLCFISSCDGFAILLVVLPVFFLVEKNLGCLSAFLFGAIFLFIGRYVCFLEVFCILFIVINAEFKCFDVVFKASILQHSVTKHLLFSLLRLEYGSILTAELCLLFISDILWVYFPFSSFVSRSKILFFASFKRVCKRKSIRRLLFCCR